MISLPRFGRPCAWKGRAYAHERIQVWIIDDGDLNLLRGRLKNARQRFDFPARASALPMAFNPRCRLAARYRGRNTKVVRAVVMDFDPRLRRHSTDLTMVTILSEAVTNEVGRDR